MLSKDEISRGRTFILKLWDARGTPMQWIETLSGDLARRWYDIYRYSDWNARRVEARAVFSHPVTESHAEDVRSSRQRCIYIHAAAVAANELAGSGAIGDRS